MRRAQAAMEFLMTYGWAVLVVIGAITALAYFGVFQHTKIIPAQCVVGPGIHCDDYAMQETEATFVLRNGLGNPIIIDTIALETCQQNYSSQVEYGRAETFVMTNCTFGNSGSVFKEDITVTFTDTRTGFQKSTYGKVVAHIQ